MRLIDADKINFLWTPIAPIYISDDVHYESIAFKKKIDAQPTIDPVKHAHWIYHGSDYLWKCSKCGNVIYSEHESDRRIMQAYCSRCGAKMDEVTERGNND